MLPRRSPLPEPFPDIREEVSSEIGEKFAIREAFSSVVNVIVGLLKSGVSVLLSGFCQPKKEKPGFGNAVIVEVRDEDTVSQVRKFRSL